MKKIATIMIAQTIIKNKNNNNKFSKKIRIVKMELLNAYNAKKN